MKKTWWAALALLLTLTAGHALASSALPHDLVVEEGAVVEIAGPIVIAEDTVISGSGTLRLSSSWNSTEPVFTILPGATLTIDGVTIDGNGVQTKLKGYSSDDDNTQGSFICCEGSLSLKSGKITNIASAQKGNNSGMIFIHDGGSFVMDGGTISNNKCVDGSGWHHGVVFIDEGGEFTMNDGSINNNSFKDDDDEYLQSGIVLVNSGATFTMTGGAIEDNPYRGVYVGSPSGRDTTPATFIMEGGAIQNNNLVAEKPGSGDYSDAQLRAWAESGAIYADAIGAGVDVESGHFKMSGGVIKGNNGLLGGGVAIRSLIGRNGSILDAVFEMTGGEIIDNTAWTGGGIFVSTTDVEALEAADVDSIRILSGTITGNSAEYTGGGIYNVRGTRIWLENALITDNEAGLMGGGLWACPTADMEMYITNGGAVFENKAGSTNSEAGDDIVSLPKNDGHETVLARRSLGGGTATYYEDGTVTGNRPYPYNIQNELGRVTDDSKRYDPSADDNTPINGLTNTTERAYALKSVFDEQSTALAQAMATVIISGNSANRGGGIGTNGSIIIGSVPDPDDPTSGEYDLIVEKVWEGFSGSNADYFAQLELVAHEKATGKDYPIETFRLTPQNPTHTLTGLGVLPEGWNYQVKETDAQPKDARVTCTATQEADPQDSAAVRLGQTGQAGKIRVVNSKSGAAPTPKPTRTPRPDDPRFSFTFTKRWTGWQQGKPEKDIQWTLYQPNGTVYSHRFTGKRNGMVWTYRAALSVDGCYLIEKPIPGYTTTYVNVGKYAQVTDRCYPGGTIINSPIPRTGDDTPLLPILGAMALSALCTTVLAFSRKKEEHQ